MSCHVMIQQSRNGRVEIYVNVRGNRPRRRRALQEKTKRRRRQRPVTTDANAGVLLFGRGKGVGVALIALLRGRDASRIGYSASRRGRVIM
jgi:hypothetical protein